MNLKLIVEKSEITPELLNLKIAHYKEIFGEQWEKVFREAGFFKDNYEVSNAYFNVMRDFMLAHPPR